MTMGEFVDKMIAAIYAAPELKNSTLMKIHTDAVHETEGIIIAHLFSNINGRQAYETTIAYNIPDISWKAEKIAELRKLVDEIEDLAYWTHDYAGIMDDEEREKMSNASTYLHVLKELIKICPDETLSQLPLF